MATARSPEGPLSPSAWSPANRRMRLAALLLLLAACASVILCSIAWLYVCLFTAVSAVFAVGGSMARGNIAERLACLLILAIDAVLFLLEVSPWTGDWFQHALLGFLRAL
jgi:hypothetical protein